MASSSFNVPKLKYTNKNYEVTTTANSYVSPYGAIGQYIIPQADLEAYGYPISGAVTTAGYPTCPVLVSANQLQICTYSAGTYTVAVRFLKLI